MRGGRARVDHDVVWDDDLPPDGTSAAGTPPQDRGRRLPARGRRLLAVGVALAVVAGVVVDRAGDRRETARLAGVDGLSVSLAAPLVPAWQVPGDVVVGSGAGVVLVAARSDGATTAVDEESGAVLFTERARCSFPDAGETGAAHADAALVVCVRDATSRVGGTTVAVRDAGTGGLVRDVPWDARSPVVTAAGLLVSVLPEPAGRTTVTAVTVRTGATRWSVVLPGSAAPGSVGAGSATDGTLPVPTPVGTVFLDVRTGRSVPAPSGARPLPSGGQVRQDGVGARATTTVLDEDAVPLVTVPGTVVVAPIDDGTADGLLYAVRRDPGADGLALTAIDATTGDRRWGAAPPAMTPSPPTVLAGRVLVPTLRGVVALDAATGAPAWELPATAGPGDVQGLATDGRRVLQVEPDPRGVPRLVARDVRTGTVRWTAAAPPSDDASGRWTTVVLPDAAVLVVGGGRVTRVVPPAGSADQRERAARTSRTAP